MCCPLEISSGHSNAEQAIAPKGVGVQSHNLGVQSHNLGVQSHNLGVQSHNLGVQSHNLGVQSHNLGVQSHDLGVQSHNLAVQSYNLAVEAEVALSVCFESVSLPLESGSHWHTCTADTPYRIAVAPPIHKPDRHWRLRPFQQEVRSQRR